MNLNKEHFDHWLEVWCETVDEMYEGTIAERAKFRGNTMAKAFYSKIRKADGKSNEE
jgi:hemoglobin